MLKMMTFIWGDFLVARAVTSIPFSRGMAMSRMATSGSSVSHSRRDSAPSAASPTISTPGSVSRSDLIPRRTMPWSSASSTLIRAFLPRRHRDVDLEGGAGSRPRMEGEVPPYLPDPLLDPDQADARALLVHVKADPVVVDAQVQAAAGIPQRPLHPSRARVPRAVRQGFLDDPVHGGPVGLGQPV